MRKANSIDTRTKKSAARRDRPRATSGKTGTRDAARIRRLRQAVERLQAKVQASGVAMTSADHATGLYED